MWGPIKGLKTKGTKMCHQKGGFPNLQRCWPKFGEPNYRVPKPGLRISGKNNFQPLIGEKVTPRKFWGNSPFLEVFFKVGLPKPRMGEK